MQVGSDTATTLSYDSFGRLASSTQGSVNQKTYTYNSAGFLQSVTDALSEVTSYVYDLTGRVISVTLPDSRVIGYNYDANGNVTSVTPPSKPAHGFTFNAMELASTYAPPVLTGVSVVNTTYAYNLDKQLTQITKPNGDAIKYNYGAGTGLLSSVVIPTGVFYYGYISNTGQLGWHSSPDGYTDNLTYQGERLLSDTQVSPSITFGTVSYGYDTDFRLASRSVQGSSATPALTENITYNGDNQPTQYGNMVLSYTYPSGRLSTTTMNNIADVRTYDAYGNLASYTASYTPSGGGSAQVLYSYTLTRDTLSRVITKVETIQGVTDTYNYSYDTAGRLTQVLKDGAVYSSYSYDSNSNRTSGVQAGTAFTASFDNQDRMLTYNGIAFHYDANGTRSQNVYSSGTTAYTFDALGKIKGATTSSGNVSAYTTDGLSRRVTQVKNGVLKWHILYDQQSRPAAVVDGTGILSKDYSYATGRNVPDYITTTTGMQYRVITDYLGSVRLVVDTSAGTVSQRMDYDDLGNVVNDTNAGYQNFGYAGGMYDPTTGIVTFGARDYDAADGGVWMTKDPILFEGGDTNLYGYVLNDPINYVDPAGTSINQTMSSSDQGGSSRSSACESYDNMKDFLDTASGPAAALGSVLGKRWGIAISSFMYGLEWSNMNSLSSDEKVECGCQ